jgi:hypothetical protein
MVKVGEATAVPKSALSAEATFERHFLETRSKLLDIAANLDRLDRARGSAQFDDPRLRTIRAALEVLASGQPARAERLQMLFSRPYDADWLTEFEREFAK